MENISLYPTLTPDMLQNSGYVSDKYVYTYSYQVLWFAAKRDGNC